MIRTPKWVLFTQRIASTPKLWDGAPGPRGTTHSSRLRGGRTKPPRGRHRRDIARDIRLSQADTAQMTWPKTTELVAMHRSIANLLPVFQLFSDGTGLASSTSKGVNEMTAYRKSIAAGVVAGFLSAAVSLSAQETIAEPQQQLSGGWRKFSETRQEARPLPQFVMPAGTWITVRVNQTLSSNYSQPGQVFTAMLTEPLVVNGFVVARRGQTVEGRISEVQKAGRVKGMSRLGIELTEVGLADGQQMPVRTQLMEYAGGTSKGRDATAVGTSAGLGAAVGAAADGGFGAGVGALAGAAASTIGVLVTRGRATEVYPETPVTFRTLEPITISTDRSQQAFQPVGREDYQQTELRRRASPPSLERRTPFYYGFGYPYYSPYFYGPSFFYYSGPRYFGGGSFYSGRGFFGGRGYYGRLR